MKSVDKAYLVIVRGGEKGLLVVGSSGERGTGADRAAVMSSCRHKAGALSSRQLQMIKNIQIKCFNQYSGFVFNFKNLVSPENEKTKSV